MSSFLNLGNLRWDADDCVVAIRYNSLDPQKAGRGIGVVSELCLTYDWFHESTICQREMGAGRDTGPGACHSTATEAWFAAPIQHLLSLSPCPRLAGRYSLPSGSGGYCDGPPGAACDVEALPQAQVPRALNLA